MPNQDLNKILFVDDDEDICVISKIALENVGKFSIICLSNGKEALEQAEAFEPDLILLDVMMPGMDGISLLQEFRQKERFKSTPIVFMTAKVQPAEIDYYRSLGAADVVIKPFDPMMLAEQLRQIYQRATIQAR